MDGPKSSRGRILNTISRVCERTDLGRSKVYELMDTGVLKSVKVGRRRLITETSLMAWFAELLDKAV